MLEAIITGDIHLPGLPQPDIPHDVQPVRPPVIYRLSLVDSDGNRPSRKVFKKVRRIAKKYQRRKLPRHTHEAIDTYRRPRLLSHETYKYVSSKEDKMWYTEESRVDALNTFLKAAKTTSQLSTIGFTADPEVRATQHRQHAGSNFILNLFEAILAVTPEIKLKYKQLFQPVFQVFEPSHGIAEIVFTRLACCTVNYGGCTRHPAGRSVRKLKEISGQCWRELEDLAMQTTPLQENWTACKEKLRASEFESMTSA